MRDFSLFFFFFSCVISTPLNSLTSTSKSNGVLLIAKTPLLFVSGKNADGTKRLSCFILWYHHIWLKLSTFFSLLFPKATYCFLSLTKFYSIKRIQLHLSVLSVILFSSFSKEKKKEIDLLSWTVRGCYQIEGSVFLLFKWIWFYHSVQFPLSSYS